MLPRWRAESGVCPVRTLARYVKARPHLRPMEPLFPAANRRAWSRFVADSMQRMGTPGGGPRSARRGGMAHLRAHIADDERSKLCGAGGWLATNRRMVELYAGVAIETTKHWSTLMNRPVTMLHGYGD